MVGEARVYNVTTSGEWKLTVQLCMLNSKYVQMYLLGGHSNIRLHEVYISPDAPDVRTKHIYTNNQVVEYTVHCVMVCAVLCVHLYVVYMVCVFQKIITSYNLWHCRSP